MKKLLVTTLITGALTVSAFAQGTVSLNATSGHGLIRYTTDGTTIISVPAGATAAVGTYGQLNLAVYSATAGTASPFTATTPSLLPSAWTESDNLLHQIAPTAGSTPTATVTFGGLVGGSSVEVMVLGWTGTFTDWNSALTAGTGLLGWTGSTLSTGALHWLNGTGAPNGSPPTNPVGLTYGANGFNGLVLTPVPEPASFALAGLGLASLLIFRRRK